MLMSVCVPTAELLEGLTLLPYNVPEQRIIF
jgi:hypothetical protein